MKYFFLCIMCVMMAWAPIQSIYAQEDNTVVAQEEMIQPAAESMTEEATTSSEKTVEYIMPYPGMLPDHPLYFLKKLRDSVMSFLISDPVKKIEFSLLKSDKYMGMAVILKEKGNWDLVKTVLTDSNMNFNAALVGVEQMKSGGVVVPDQVIVTLMNAGSKHKEVLESLRQGADETQDQMITAAKSELEAMRVELE